MKSGSLGKLTTRPNVWELLYNNEIDKVCTFDFRVINKVAAPTVIDLLITAIPISILPANDSDYYVLGHQLDGNASYDKKSIVIGEFDYVYVRSRVTPCVVTVNGIINTETPPTV